MSLVLKFVLLFSVCFAALSARADVFFDVAERKCPPLNKGGVDYILHVRRSDYGWKEHTHRANIALAVNKWVGTNDEMLKMELQLEEEIIKFLLRNQTNPSTEYDLAMFIHALIATKKNPWDFHGLNLVEDLLYRVNDDQNVHPFLVLALCNSHAVEERHLNKIGHHLESKGENPEDIANKAIALKAYACAASLPYAKRLGLDMNFRKLDSPFKRAMNTAQQFLVKHQEREQGKDEGKFGNVYTTSLVVQALTAYEAAGWSEEKALSYLERQSKIDVNLLQAYYIVLALNARNVRCIKDLYGEPFGPPELPKPGFSITYSIVDEQDPDIYFTVYMKVPTGSNFFQVMEKAGERSANFKFSHVLDKSDKPFVYEMIGKPNDAEQNFFWTICRQSRVNHAPRSSTIETLTTSPANIEVHEAEHFFLRYTSSSCPGS